MNKQEKIDFVLNDLRELLNKCDDFNVEAFVHSKEVEFGTQQKNIEVEDGCVVYYLNGSNAERLYGNLQERFTEKSAEQMLNEVTYEDIEKVILEQEAVRARCGVEKGYNPTDTLVEDLTPYADAQAASEEVSKS